MSTIFSTITGKNGENPPGFSRYSLMDIGTNRPLNGQGWLRVLSKNEKQYNEVGKVGTPCVPAQGAPVASKFPAIEIGGKIVC